MSAHASAASGCEMCGRPVGPRPENKGWPFCSPRCKQVDLGRWLNEEYRISRPLDETEQAEVLGDGRGESSDG